MPASVGPQASADDAGDHGQHDDERGGEGRVLQQAQDPGGEHRAQDDLSFHPDVPQAGGEGDEDAGRRQQERDPGHQDVREAASEPTAPLAICT